MAESRGQPGSYACLRGSADPHGRVPGAGCRAGGAAPAPAAGAKPRARRGLGLCLGGGSGRNPGDCVFLLVLLFLSGGSLFLTRAPASLRGAIYSAWESNGYCLVFGKHIAIHSICICIHISTDKLIGCFAGTFYGCIYISWEPNFN